MMLSKMQMPEGTDPMQALGNMPEEARKQMLETVDEKLSDMPESILTQAAVSGVKAEYEAMGEDLDDFESDVGANYKLRYEVQEIDTASERKMSTLTLLQSGCFLTD